MKSIDELEGCLEGDDRILFETEHCCAFHRNGRLWFANDISEDGWFESESLCEIAFCYQQEVADAVRSLFCRAEEYYFDGETNTFVPRRGQRYLSPVNRTHAELADDVVILSIHFIYWGLHTTEGQFRIIRRSTP